MINHHLSPFEDTWHDIMIKAMRGLSITPLDLVKKSSLGLSEVESLIDGCLNQEHLLKLASTLSLHPQALIELACEKKHPSSLKLPENLIRITTSFHNLEVHSYLLWDDKSKEAVAFDTGSNCSKMLEELQKKKLKLLHVFLTHKHHDHCDDLDCLLKKTNAQAWINSLEVIEKTTAIPSNSSWNIGDLTVTPRATPGHSPGGMSYLIEGLSPSVIIVGDALFARSIGGVLSPSYQSALKYIRNNILSLPPSTMICPGHGPISNVEEELLHNPFFRQDCS